MAAELRARNSSSLTGVVNLFLTQRFPGCAREMFRTRDEAPGERVQEGAGRVLSHRSGLPGTLKGSAVSLTPASTGPPASHVKPMCVMLRQEEIEGADGIRGVSQLGDTPSPSKQNPGAGETQSAQNRPCRRLTGVRFLAPEPARSEP